MLVPYREESNLEDPVRARGEFENILDLGNIGNGMIWEKLLRSVKRGDIFPLKYHRCFHNPVSCFK